MASNSSSIFLDLHHPVHRRAIRTAVAILLAAGLVYLLKPPHGEWIILSAFLVSQDSVGSSLWKAQGRFLGAVLGAIASLMLYGVIGQHHILIFIAAYLAIFPYVYLVTALNNYLFAFFFLQVAYVCFLAAVGKQPSAGLIEWRAASIMIGIALGIAVALFVLPTSARPRLQKEQLKAWITMHHWFDEIAKAYQSPDSDHRQLEQLSRTAQHSVFKLEEHLASRKHELIGKAKAGFNWMLLRQKDTEFIQGFRPIYRSLLNLSQVVQDSDPATRPAHLSPATDKVIQHLSTTFDQMNHAISSHSLLPVSPPDQAASTPSSTYSPEAAPASDELNFRLHLEQVAEAIACLSDQRNQFLSLLEGNTSGQTQASQ